MAIYVGIDIAAKTFEVAIRENGEVTSSYTVKQTTVEQTRFVEAIQSMQPTCIVMEATGIYFLDLAKALERAGLPISVINPKSFKQFADLMLARTKTDAVDASLLAEYGQRMEPALWEAPSDEALSLRDISRHINRLVYMNTQAKNRLHAMLASRDTSRLIIDDEREGIEHTERRIKRLRRAAIDMVRSNHRLSKQLDHMTTAKGISERSAICILGELNVLPKNMKAKQVCHYAGLSVKLRQSGTSVNAPGRLTKAGNGYLRSALFMPAMAAATMTMPRRSRRP